MTRARSDTSQRLLPVRRTASLSYIWQKQNPAPPPGPMGPSAMRLFAHHLAQPQARWPAKSRLSGSAAYGVNHMTTFSEGFQVRICLL